MGYTLVLDPSEIIPDDPGAGTPALVYDPTRRHSSTYYCALENGDCDGYTLPDSVQFWLGSDKVAAMVDALLLG
jgi:hypothetical protein